MKKTLLTAVVCGLAFCGTWAIAAPEGDKPKKPADPAEMFKKMDANGDGKVSKEEFTAKAKDDAAKEKAAARFAKLDTNGDGSLSLDEFKAGMKPKKPKTN